MSYGRTGLIIRVWYQRGWFNTVKVMHVETYETTDCMTCVEYVARRIKFPSRFRANLFLARMSAGQGARYES